MFYRYENRRVSIGVDAWDESLGSREELYCFEYEVITITPKGARVLDSCFEGNERPVLDRYKNKFAYPTKGEALLGFIHRKKRQQAILTSQIGRSHEAQQIAEHKLVKELACNPNDNP